MAQRDRSQGFGFVYVDIGALLAQRDSIQKEFHSPVETGASQAVNFPKIQPIPAPTPPAPAQAQTAPKDHQNAVQQIRENLDRLQSLHHKLHAMLEELNQISNRKK